MEKTQKSILHIEDVIWKDICGYEGLYQISNKGKIKIIKDGNIKILEIGILGKKFWAENFLEKHIRSN